MAQAYNVNSSIKQLRNYSLTGGMVSQFHPEKLADGQSTLIENADVIAGGSLINRGGYAQVVKCEVTYNTLGDIEDENITFQTLKDMTFETLKNVGFTNQLNDEGIVNKTFGDIHNAGFTFKDLKSYTFDQVENDGIVGFEEGTFQGIFRYQGEDGYTDVLAIKGKLYAIINNNTYKKLVIEGLKSFQTSRPVEAVQYRDKMYIATGAGLVVYDGTKASLVNAYVPNGLEALYIGTNGYAKDPNNYLIDTVGSSNTILGVTTSSRYGVVNKDTTFTAYVQQISGNILEYKFETMPMSGSYSTAQDWSTSKELVQSFGTIEDYRIKVSLRVQGTTLVLQEYVLPKYTVKEVYDATKEKQVSYDNISLCNRILVHYDRLMMYGDYTNPDYLYISHLNEFSYFPVTNTITVTDPLRGKLRSVTRFKDFLVCFTDASIQQISGTSSTNFEVKPIHTSLGTNKPYSVQVLRNYLAFVGSDNGVYILKQFNPQSDKMNVQRLDDVVRDMVVGSISTATRVLSCVYDNQYFLYTQTPEGNYIYRYYENYNVWVRDVIDLDFKVMTVLDNVVTLTSPYNGIIYKLQRGLFHDGEDKIFSMRVHSKDYNMDAPHHRKKMKQFQLLAKMTELTSMEINIYGDNNLLTSKYITHDPNENTDAEKLKVTTSGRFRYLKTEIEIPIVEDVELLGYAFVFKYNSPK